MTQARQEDKYKVAAHPLARNGETILMLPPEVRILSGDTIGARPHVWVWQPAIPRNNPAKPFTFFVCDEHEAFVPPQNAMLIGAMRTINIFIFWVGPDAPGET
jgi:hypothetical protein